METKKRRVIWPYILAGILIIIALGVAGYYWLQGTQEPETDAISIELDAPQLPRIASIEEGYEVNELLPYTTQMEMETMRDALSILTPQGKLNLVIYPNESEVVSLTYEVYSLDGSKLLQEDVVTDIAENEVSLSLGNVVTSVEESLLQMTLTLDDGTQVYYYTRVIAYGSCYLSQNLDFIAQFHANTFANDTEALTDATGVTTTTTSSTWQEITMYSDVEQLAWGELEPEIIGEVEWTITECTSLFMSVQLEYQVTILGEADEDGNQTLEYYNVTESYRVGYSTSNTTVELKQYQRTMNKILKKGNLTITEDGIDLGIVDSDSITYMINDEKSVVAFVQERILYIYNQESNQISKVFSLEGTGTDVNQYPNDEYDIRILSIDEEGNMNFVVYGYMNRGEQEGSVGAAIYYYNSWDNTVMEKAFIANTQSFAVGQDEMSQGIYYSSTLDVVYVIAQNALYEVVLSEGTQTILANDLAESQYTISDDGKLVAFITEEEQGTLCTVLDFETGESYEVTTSDSAKIQPLGFLNHDFIYGEYYDNDVLVDETGSEITPMYLLGICDEEGTIQKTYEQANQYIRNISIVDNMVTINLVEQEVDEYVYAGQDVITNNAVQEAEGVAISTYTTENLLQQVRLEITVDSDVLEDLAIAKVQLIENDAIIRISYENQVESGMYFAYAYGQIQVISSMASDAIQYASANVGVVVNSNHEYVWRSGYRDLTYTVSNYSDLVSRMSGGESAIDIVSDSANQNVVSYTGCTTEQMCYLINNGQVIAAKLDDDSWILLVGYTGSTMYYLDESGSKHSITMTTLDGQIMELIGDGIF